jgi:nitrogen fixation protein FixH
MSAGGSIWRGERPITGRMVFGALVAFFGFVVLVNLVMVRAAITTFGGVDTPSSYQAGLDFKAEEAKAAAQAARRWTVDARMAPTAEGTALSFQVRDAAGRPVTGAEVTTRLAHPVDQRRDVAVAVSETEAGVYSGRVAVDPGQWTLDIEMAKGGERLFRSRNRIVIE